MARSRNFRCCRSEPGESGPAQIRFQFPDFALQTFWKLLPAFLLALLVIGIWYSLAKTGMRYEWQWNRVWRHFGEIGPEGFTAGPLLKGIGLTCGITLAGGALSFLAGLCAVLMRLSPWPVCIFAAKAYVALWRNTPLLLQLFFAYFLISPLLHLSPFWTAVLALALFEGAYLCEILRAGVLSVERTQWEAALSLGFSLRETLLLVILPQAGRNIQPALLNQAVGLLKDTSLVSAIAVADLTMASQAIVAETFLAFEVWLLAGAIYLLLALAITAPGLLLEARRRWR